MAVITKTDDVTPIIALQVITTNSIIDSGAVSLETKLGSILMIRLGRTVSTALSVGVRVRVEVSPNSTGDDTWFTIAQYQTGVAAANTGKDITTQSNSGQATVTMTTTTGLAQRDKIFIYDTVTLGNSEFHRVKTVNAGASIVLERNLANTQPTTSDVFNQVQEFLCYLDALAITRVRVIIDTLGVGQSIVGQAFVIHGDSIG